MPRFVPLNYPTLVVAAVLPPFVLLALRWANLGVDNASATLIAVVLYLPLTALLFVEAREDRLTQRRPYVVVDVDDPSRGGSDVPDSFYEPGPRLNIRNLGQTAAADVKVRFNNTLNSEDGEDVSGNPSLRDGFALIAPGQTWSLPLEKNFWFGIGIEAQPWFQEGETPPPTQPATITVSLSYRDATTNRTYRETHRLDVAPFVFGWSSSSG